MHDSGLREPERGDGGIGREQVRSGPDPCRNLVLEQSMHEGHGRPVQLGVGTGVSAAVYHGESVTQLLGDNSYFQMHETERQLINTPYGQQWSTRSDSYVRLLSVGTQPGFMGVVSGYAPTGGDRFEDLCLLDPTNPKQWLLVIVQPVGLDVHIYRRLYVLEN